MSLPETVVVTVEEGAKRRRYVVAREDAYLFNGVPDGKVPKAELIGTRAPSIANTRNAREQHLGRFSFGCQWLRSLGKVDEQYRTLSTWEVVKVERMSHERAWGF